MTVFSDRPALISPPEVIRHREMLEASRPLLDLLGVTSTDVYEVTVSVKGVRLTVPALPDDADKRSYGDDPSYAEWVRDIFVPTDIA